MPLTQADRIAISKKIIEIPLQDAQSDKISAQLEGEKVKAQKEDTGNKVLMDEQTPLINLYQSEVQTYNGQGRTQLVEQDIVDSSKKTFQNNFFPNDPVTPLPNESSGVWKLFVAFSKNKAIGRNYNETFFVVTSEQSKIDAINTQITTIEALTAVIRSTGQECIPGALPPPDSIQAHPGMQAAATAMNIAVQDWEDFMNTTSGLVPTGIQDSDVGRTTENDASRSDITAAIVVVDTWQALSDFDTTHGQVTCAGFNSIDVSTLNPTKFRAAELQLLKDEIAARQTFINTRVTQIEGHLGSVTQDLATGEITAAVGFYGIRFRFIDMRLNLMGGSLAKAKSFELGQNAQDQSKKSNANAGSAYTSVMVATGFRAPGAGTETIHVLDATGFSVSDSVFIAAENQTEITTTIQSINGNRIVLADIVPKKYRETEAARLYKIL